MVYHVPERANIRNIKDIHSELLTALKNSGNVEIDTSGCTDVDLSLIQVIEALRKSATIDGKQISLAKPADGIVQTTLKRAGLLESMSAADSKFWLHKEIH